jgi:diketogulonate reductase-like aldo/keto reductase
MNHPRPSPVLVLNNGVEMPALGLGVLHSPSEHTAAAVHAAIHCGYRLVDTAAAYRNEREVGEGIVRSGVARPELFVTTKLWMTDYGYDETRRACDTSLRKLGLDYLDLYLLHWPTPASFDATVASYRALEQLLADGRVRAIGVSNFNPSHLDELVERTEVVPAVNQIEQHPFFTQLRLLDADERLGIVTQAWSPIGGVYGRNPGAAPTAATSPLTHPVILRLAAEHHKTAAQVMLRWHLDQGRSAIPKSVRPERIAENFDIFDFALDGDDLKALDDLDTGVRAGSDPEVVNASTFSITIDPA